MPKIVYSRKRRLASMVVCESESGWNYHLKEDNAECTLCNIKAFKEVRVDVPEKISLLEVAINGIRWCSTCVKTAKIKVTT